MLPRRMALFIVLVIVPSALPAEVERVVVLEPARVFDGVSAEARAGWVVVVKGDRIDSAGPAAKIKLPRDARTVKLPGLTLLPGLIGAENWT